MNLISLFEGLVQVTVVATLGSIAFVLFLLGLCILFNNRQL